MTNDQSVAEEREQDKLIEKRCQANEQCPIGAALARRKAERREVRENEVNKESSGLYNKYFPFNF